MWAMNFFAIHPKKSFLLILSLVVLFVFSGGSYVSYADDCEPDCNHHSEGKGKSEGKKTACIDHNCCSHSHNTISGNNTVVSALFPDVKEVYLITQSYNPDKFKSSPLLEPPSIS